MTAAPATSPILLSIVMLAAFALFLGGGRLLWRGGPRAKGWLMIAAGLVLVGNVLIWIVPLPR